MENTMELRKLDVTKLVEKLTEKRKELMDKKLMRSTGKENDTSLFSKVRKDIARIQTVMKEKEVLNERTNS